MCVVMLLLDSPFAPPLGPTISSIAKELPNGIDPFFGIGEGIVVKFTGFLSPFALGYECCCA
jgi:hypothetical protein